MDSQRKHLVRWIKIQTIQIPVPSTRNVLFMVVLLKTAKNCDRYPITVWLKLIERQSNKEPKVTVSSFYLKIYNTRTPTFETGIWNLLLRPYTNKLPIFDSVLFMSRFGLNDEKKNGDFGGYFWNYSIGQRINRVFVKTGE